MLNFDHRHLYHVGCSSLYRRINGITFGKTPNGKISRVNIPEPSFTPHQRFNITIFPCKIDGIIHILLNIGKLLFIIIYDLFGFGPGYTQVFCEAKCSLAINDTKIYTLGFIPHFFGHG